jgi:predicted GNAT family N-acyltransferase
LKRAGPARIEVRLGSWEELGAQALRIRLDVFVAEQGIPAGLELDAMDPVCVHALAWRSGDTDTLLGTGRLLPDGHIGRIAVVRTARGQGVGSALLLTLMRAARDRGHEEVELFAQTDAAAFYRRFGFETAGPEFDEAGIAHITMRARLSPG